jgi:hypothetical protein
VVGSYRGEILPFWFDALECKGLNSFGTVKNDGFPNAEPVLYMSCSGHFLPIVQVWRCRY